MSLWWVFGFYLLERALEMLLSGRNRRWLLERSGRELCPQCEWKIVWLHTFFFLSLVVESAPWRVPFDRFTVNCLILMAILQVLRYWGVASRGRLWSTHLIVLPGAPPICRGPYLFTKYPNDLVETLEFIVIPMMMRSPLTLVFFTFVNLAVVRRRIRLQEQQEAAASPDQSCA